MRLCVCVVWFIDRHCRGVESCRYGEEMLRAERHPFVPDSVGLTGQQSVCRHEPETLLLGESRAVDETAARAERVDTLRGLLAYERVVVVGPWIEHQSVLRPVIKVAPLRLAKRARLGQDWHQRHRATTDRVLDASVCHKAADPGLWPVAISVGIGTVELNA